MIFVTALFLIFGVYNAEAKCTHDLKDHPVHLTFDDGPDPLTTPRILDTLKAHGIKATFFLCGYRFEDKKSRGQLLELVKRMKDEGHTVASHTHHHRPHTSMPNYETIKANMDSNSNGLRHVKKYLSPVVRLPYGAGWFSGNPGKTELIKKAYRKLKLSPLHWDIDTNDWNAKYQNAGMTERLLREVCEFKGGVILMHDSSANNPNGHHSFTADHLEDFIIRPLQKAQVPILSYPQMKKANKARPLLDQWLSFEPNLVTYSSCFGNPPSRAAAAVSAGSCEDLAKKLRLLYGIDVKPKLFRKLLGGSQ